MCHSKLLKLDSENKKLGFMCVLLAIHSSNAVIQVTFYQEQDDRFFTRHKSTNYDAAHLLPVAHTDPKSVSCILQQFCA